MNEIKKEFYEKKAKRVVETLNKRKYNALYVDNLAEAKEKVIELISKNSTIAMGGSITLNQMGMAEYFRNGDYNFIDRFSAETYEEEVELYKKGLTADYFVTGTNAITEDGYILNIDSSGNRCASITFGPKTVIIVVGFNKIVKDITEGLKRLEEIAPMNCKRLKGHNDAPCVETGICVDCMIPSRMCNYISIVKQGGKFPDRFQIIVVGEEVGF